MSGALLWDCGRVLAMPVGFVTLASTDALQARPKVAAARILWRSDRGDVPPRGTVHVDIDDDGRVIAVHNVIATAKLARFETAFEDVC